MQQELIGEAPSESVYQPKLQPKRMKISVETLQASSIQSEQQKGVDEKDA